MEGCLFTDQGRFDMTLTQEEVAAVFSGQLPLSEQEEAVARWQYGAGIIGDFEHSLWQTIQLADDRNLYRLRKGFPFHVSGYMRYRFESGWWEIVEQKIMSELRIARMLSKSFVRFPRLAFGMLDRSNGAWRAICNLMLGEIDYAAVKRKAGGFKSIFNRLLRA